MNNNIVEIIGILIEKLFNDKYNVDENETIDDLINLGYDIQDIDEAFALIYNSTEIIEQKADFSLDENTKTVSYNRIFSLFERFYLPLYLQGIIRKLLYLKVLTPQQNEDLILRLLQICFNGKIRINQLWNVLEEIIQKEDLLDFVLTEIPEFKNFIPGEFKYVN